MKQHFFPKPSTLATGLALGGIALVGFGCAHPEPQVAYVPVYRTGPAYVIQQPPPPGPPAPGAVVTPAPATTYWQAPPPAPSPPPQVVAPPQRTVILAPSAPPPPIVERIPVAPAPHYVWASGHWGWNRGWVWVGGSWVARPGPKAVWVNGRWTHRGHGWVWVGGGWR